MKSFMNGIYLLTICTVMICDERDIATLIRKRDNLREDVFRHHIPVKIHVNLQFQVEIIGAVFFC